MGLLEPDVYLWWTLIFGSRRQVLVTKWSQLGGLTTWDSFAEFKSPSKNLANVQKDFEKAILKKLLGLR